MNIIIVILKYMFSVQTIIIVALINLIIYVSIIKKNRDITSMLAPRKRRAELKNNRNSSVSVNETDIKNAIKSLNSFYTSYSNVVSIFPLLGMGGTVVSLLSLAQNSNSLSTVEMDSFFMALTTTIAGTICAVIGKIADSFISPDIADINKEYDLLTQRNTAESSRGEQ